MHVDEADMGFLPDEVKRNVRAAIKKLPPAATHAALRLLYQRPELTDRTLEVLRHPAMVAAEFWTRLERSIPKKARTMGGPERCIFDTLLTMVVPPKAPKHGWLKDKKAKRAKAAAHVHSALADLDEIAANLSLFELVELAESVGKPINQKRAQATGAALRAVPDAYYRQIVAPALTVGDLLYSFACALESGSRLTYHDDMAELAPSPKVGNTRDRIWFERVLENLFRVWTGRPHHELIAAAEAAALGIATHREEVKNRLKTARKKA